MAIIGGAWGFWMAVFIIWIYNRQDAKRRERQAEIDMRADERRYREEAIDEEYRNEHFRLLHARFAEQQKQEALAELAKLRKEQEAAQLLRANRGRA